MTRSLSNLEPNGNADGDPEVMNDDALLGKAVAHEFDRYRAEVLLCLRPGKCLDWWKSDCTKFPRIAKVASVMLGQPVGTPDVERRCSEAGNIITKLRNRLGNQKAANLFFIHANGRAEWATRHPNLQFLYKGILAS